MLTLLTPTGLILTPMIKTSTTAGKIGNVLFCPQLPLPENGRTGQPHLFDISYYNIE